jgi:hypothetical protein
MFLLNDVDAYRFNGLLFSKSDGSEGCLIHHMYHAGRLPRAVTKYINGSSEGASCFDDRGFLSILDTTYGDGASKLFGDTAADCGTDITEFTRLLREFITYKDGFVTTDRIAFPCSLAPRSNSGEVSYRVAANGKEFCYDDLTSAETSYNELVKYGVDAQLTRITIETLR